MQFSIPITEEGLPIYFVSSLLIYIKKLTREGWPAFSPLASCTHLFYMQFSIPTTKEGLPIYFLSSFLISISYIFFFGLGKKKIPIPSTHQGGVTSSFASRFMHTLSATVTVSIASSLVERSLSHTPCSKIASKKR